MTEALSRYDMAIPLERAITISFDVNPNEAELALATNAVSLRSATLIALLEALVVHDAAEAASPANGQTRRPSTRSLRRPHGGDRAKRP